MHRSCCLSALRTLSILGFAVWGIGCSNMHGWTTNKAGMRAYKEGNYAVAQQKFQQSLFDEPQNADYAHNLGASLKKSGDLAGAEKAYRHALVLDPSHQPAHHSLTMLLSEQGRTQEAKDVAQMWADTEPYLPESHVELAWFQRESGDIAGAEQSLKNALRIKPNHDIATAQLGDLYRSNGQNDRAVAMYQRSLGTNWFQPQVQSRLANLNASSTRMARAPSPNGYAMNPISAPVAAMPVQQQTAFVHPLPSYNVTGTPIVTQQPMMASTGPVVSAPIAANGWVPAGTVVSTPVVAGVETPTLSAPNFAADPEHSDTATNETPEVPAH